MSTTPPSKRTFVAGSSLPDDLTGVRWPDGTVECNLRLIHHGGSLVADDGEEGTILTEPDVACTVCSDACAGGLAGT